METSDGKCRDEIRPQATKMFDLYAASASLNLPLQRRSKRAVKALQQNKGRKYKATDEGSLRAAFERNYSTFSTTNDERLERSVARFWLGLTFNLATL